MPTTQTHSARSFDEQLVAYFEYDQGCVKVREGVIPPPESCSTFVQDLNGVAEWHVFSILIAAVFLGMLLSLTMSIFGGGDHH